MVWIHGGGFVLGSALPYSPSRMVTDGDVIVVTIQYRLAAFGFLSSGDGAVPGNMGMRDQLLAVNWVKDNIRQFGGDPNDITIFGESAGSASVAALALTPGSKGLFTKAILQSGTLVASWALIRHPEKEFYQFAERAGCRPWIYNPWNKLSYHQNVVTCLRTKSDREILDAHSKYDPLNVPMDKGLGEQVEFGLVTDYDFFPKAPLDLLKDKSYLQRQGVLDRTYMIGMTDNEGILGIMMYPQKKYGEITKPSNVASLIRSIVNSNFPWPAETEALNAVDFLYSFPRDADGNIPLQKVIDLYSDDLMTVPIMVFTRALVDASPSTPVYMYLFDSEPKVSNPRTCPSTPVYMYLFGSEPKVSNPRACPSTPVYMYLFDSEPKVSNPRASPGTPVYMYLFDSEPKVSNPRAFPSTPVYMYLFDSEPKVINPRIPPKTPVYMYLFDSESKLSNFIISPSIPLYMYLFDSEPKVSSPRACPSTPVYMYLFDSEPKVSNPRACHSTPLYMYLFDSEPKVSNPRASPSTPVYMYLFDSEPKVSNPRASPSTPVYMYLFDSEPKVSNPRASTGTPVYMYLFDSEPKLKDPDGPIRGTNHGMDLFHEFDGVGVDGFETLYFFANRDPAKYPIIASAFRGYVTQFAKTGNPVTGPSSSWPRYDRQNEQYLAISSQPEVRQHLYAQRVSLWTDFLPKMATRNSGRPAFSG
ncbi:carboxylic ester hydrolase [Plakobranchus ocellatus]|uniref:Carboxylic ester hydrolase n=1 Tax=Plakobranchus ocellatus TaxID=259542 RepID=A0AAV4DD77_9GAST|nr:carboxylic ester hydrolase [Plakobranchus ocellatus]